jgi:hypothetical protein
MPTDEPTENKDYGAVDKLVNDFMADDPVSRAADAPTEAGTAEEPETATDPRLMSQAERLDNAMLFVDDAELQKEITEEDLDLGEVNARTFDQEMSQRMRHVKENDAIRSELGEVITEDITGELPGQLVSATEDGGLQSTVADEGATMEERPKAPGKKGRRRSEAEIERDEAVDAAINEMVNS